VLIHGKCWLSDMAGLQLGLNAILAREAGCFLSIYPCIYLSIYLFIHPSNPVYLSIFLSIYPTLSINLSFCLSIYRERWKYRAEKGRQVRMRLAMFSADKSHDLSLMHRLPYLHLAPYSNHVFLIPFSQSLTNTRRFAFRPVIPQLTHDDLISSLTNVGGCISHRSRSLIEIL